MEKDHHEQYDYARKRLKQKKSLYYHFVVLIISSIFLYIANHYFLIFGLKFDWSIWVISFWFFLFVLHFIKVFITDRFMNKSWEREQIDRLVAKQQHKIAQLEKNIEESK